jgi:predicted TPR repeat methyltransferase
MALLGRPLARHPIWRRWNGTRAWNGTFDFYAEHTEESLVHDQAVRSISTAQVFAVLKAFDFSKAGRVVDVGGGTGELLSAILSANLSLEGALFELPHVVANARNVLSEAGVVGACTL